MRKPPMKNKITNWAIAAAALALFAISAFADELPKIDWNEQAKAKPLLLAKGNAEPADAQAPAAAEIKADEPKPFSAGSFSFGSFASLRVHEFDGRTEDFGGGLFAQYMVANNIALEANVLSEGLHFEDVAFSESFTDAGANLKGYLPIGTTGFAPYGFIGYTRDLEHDENRMNAGAGLEFRTRKLFFAFIDGQWTHDFDTLGHALFRLGGGVWF